MEASEIKTRLARTLPHWHYSPKGLERSYTTSGWKSTLMVVNTLAQLAEAAWHHPELVVSYKQVTVKLITHSENAVTSKDVELAEKMESVIQWQPAQEAGELSGPPQGERYAHVHYD